MKIRLIYLMTLIFSLVFLNSCQSKKQSNLETAQIDSTGIILVYQKLLNEPTLIQISKDIRVGKYFQFMDSVVGKYDSIVPYDLSEHLLVRNNPWNIDTLESVF